MSVAVLTLASYTTGWTTNSHKGGSENLSDGNSFKAESSTKSNKPNTAQQKGQIEEHNIADYTAKVCSGIAVELQWNDCDLVLTTVVHCTHCLAALNWKLKTAVTALTWMLLLLLWNECKTYW